MLLSRYRSVFIRLGLLGSVLIGSNLFGSFFFRFVFFRVEEFETYLGTCKFLVLFRIRYFYAGSRFGFLSLGKMSIFSFHLSQSTQKNKKIEHLYICQTNKKKVETKVRWVAHVSWSKLYLCKNYMVQNIIWKVQTLVTLVIKNKNTC